MHVRDFSPIHHTHTVCFELTKSSLICFVALAAIALVVYGSLAPDLKAKVIAIVSGGAVVVAIMILGTCKKNKQPIVIPQSEIHSYKKRPPPVVLQHSNKTPFYKYSI